MSTDLTVINPLSGEILALETAQTDELARFLDDAKDCESRLKEAKSLVSREVLRRQDMSAQWTTRVGGYVLKGASPATAEAEEWDGAELREELLALVDMGVVSVEAVDAAVETVVAYKVHKTGINQLRKLGGVVADTVKKHRQVVEKNRYVSVSRAS